MTPLEYEVVINPIIKSMSAEMTRDFEGCLSFPGYQGIVTRAREIEVTFTTLDGIHNERQLSDLHARVFQV